MSWTKIVSAVKQICFVYALICVLIVALFTVNIYDHVEAALDGYGDRRIVAPFLQTTVGLTLFSQTLVLLGVWLQTREKSVD